jgi:hypothetical protein
MLRLLVALTLLTPLVYAQEFDQKARLKAAKWKWKTLRFNFPGTAAEKPVVRKAKIEKLLCLFVDLDGNGKFGEIGRDAWALSGMNYLLPMEATTVLELHRIQWKVDAEGKEVRWSSSPIPIPKAEASVFRQFNYWRLINGLPPVDIDPKLGEACNELCVWMEANGMKHRAAAGDPPMSERAAAAGMRSMLSRESPAMSIVMLYSSFYHRLPLFNPGTRAIGIGKSARYTAVDGISRVEARKWNYPVIVPAPSSALQPTHFPPESPRPYPAHVKSPGCPITLTFAHANITEAKGTLDLTVGRGRRAKKVRLPVLVSSPTAPANANRFDNRKSICIIPTSPLAPKSHYTVAVSYKENGEPRQHTWVFTTGQRRPVWHFTGR